MSKSKSKLCAALMLSIAYLVAGVEWKHDIALAKDQVTLQWLEWWDGEWGTSTMDALMKRFEDKTGIKVERTAVPWDSMYDLMIADAQGPGKYDVYGMEGCCFLTGIDKLGGVESLGPYLQRDKDFADSLTTMTPVKWRNQPMMVNWYVMPYSYVYNIDILQKAGVEAPKNWSEAIEVSKKLNDSHLVNHGLGMTFGDSSLLYPMYYLFGSRLAQLGGRLYDDQGHAIFNSKEGVAAMNWYKDLYNSGVLGSGVFGETWTQLREDFATEKVAAFIGGPFEGIIAKQVNPRIRAAYPHAWCDKTCGYQWAGSGLAMSSKSAHKAEAWEFIKFLLNEENTVYLTKKLSIPFGTKAAIASLANSDDPILHQIPPMLNGDPTHNIFLAPTPDFERLHRTFLEAFQRVLTGKQDTQEALNSVVAVWNEAIDAASKQ
jgi:ABC-type glycerol-3-phosphate transport system substrate-binding protein